MHARSADTDPEAERIQIELLRQAGTTRRAHMALALSGQVIGLARRALRRSLPGATEDEVALRFVELHYGRELAAGLRRLGTGGKLEWFRAEGEVSDRQWADVVGVIRTGGPQLDHDYSSRWAAALGVGDLFDRAWREAGPG